MTVGITYDLRKEYLEQGFGEEETAELDKIETIEAIDEALRALGFTTERIGHLNSLIRLIARGRSWDIVFNIAEGIYGLGREAQIPALLDAFKIPYTFSDPLVLSLTLHKGMTKHVVRDCGIPTPDFAVIEQASELSHVAIPFPLFAKPVAEGTGKGISRKSKINNRDELYGVISDLLERFRQPVLIEKFLPGREFTVGIVGTGSRAEALPVMEICLRKGAEEGAYSLKNKQNYKEVVEYRLIGGELSVRCAEVALSAWRSLGCRDAGRIDLRLDEREMPNFIEVNPLAGLNPIDSDLPIICRMAGISYNRLIQRIMESALERIDTFQPEKKRS